ncbi:aldo/keto reductase [Solicola sp. PLA-1-18]|uniref:aldo/keto reductase n=1 Tax=Solicola sp. PLA-1-18 TaxID=3380532 RepID=UPI003B7FD7A2
MDLSDLRTLGRSGLPVSPLTLGTMTMGNPDWGSSDEESAAIFDAYVDAGGNAIDTADVYSGGRSEELVGRFVAERGLRDQVVLATKAGFGSGGGPLTGGASRKNLTRAVEGSLRRLGTDHIDLYWLHVWDGVTPAEEVVQTLGDLVGAGKIGYYGFSDTPAWFAARAATLAEAGGVAAPVALQLEYSLVERTIEREHVVAARELGMGVVPWSPLAGGFLAGKYSRDGAGASGQGRLAGSNPFGDSKFTDANWAVLDVLREVAGEVDRPLSQVALAWTRQRPGVSTILLGTRTTDQLADNLASLEVDLPPDAIARLTEASAIDLGFPYAIYTPETMAAAVTGGVQVRGWSAGA